MTPRWPKKYYTFKRRVLALAPVLRTGTLLAIDPASGKESMPGYALFKAGELVERGTVKIDPGSTQNRLRELYDCVASEFTGIDVLAVEQLRGRMVSSTLHWSTGVIIAAVNAPTVIETPIPCWKAMAKATPGYFKSDDMDAWAIGATVLSLSKGG